MFRGRQDPFLASADAERVRRVLFLNGLRAAEIDDAMQEIELRALERPPRWTRRAARECNAPAAGEAEPADDAGVTALREAVRTGLAQLEPELRATVVLRFYADFAIAEIATSTGRSRGGSCTR